LKFFIAALLLFLGEIANSKKYNKILAKKSGPQEVYYPEIYPIS
jgi:hypothetical protein